VPRANPRFLWGADEMHQGYQPGRTRRNHFPRPVARVVP
jgi:hypothetical protein